VKRVYVPTTLAVWQRLVADGSMFQVSGTAFVVTPGESYAEQHNAQALAHQRHAAFRATKGNFGLARP
jgi:hypothetical protein